MRESLLIAFVSILSIVFLLRLLELQVFKHEHYKLLAFDNMYRTLKLNPLRGNMYDRNGKLIATNRMYARLHVVSDDSALIREYRSYISSLVGGFYEFFEMEDISKIVVRSDKLEHVVILLDGVRYYPYGELTPHIVGYTDKRNRAVSGMEKLLDSVLSGKPGKVHVPVDASMRIVSNSYIYDHPRKGKDIVLTLDMDLQVFIDSIVRPYEKLSVIVMKTNGEVLALYSKPKYDPNMFVRGLTIYEWNYINRSDLKPLMNRALTGLYPPGSVFKLLTALTALEYGWNWKRSLICDGYASLGGFVFGDWDVHGIVEDMVEAIEVSCDVYFYNLARFMGIVKLTEGLKKSNIFGRRFTYFPEEKSSFLPDTAWYKLNKGFYTLGFAFNLSIGQGEILMTPMAIAMLTGALANSGYMPYPTFVLNELPKDTLKLGYTEQAVEVVRKGMLKAVEGYMATGGYLRWKLVLNGYEDVHVAGKTGSAENPHGEKTHSLFTCFFPYEHPKFIITVVVENAGHGSEVAVPIATEIVLWLLKHYF